MAALCQMQTAGLHWPTPMDGSGAVSSSLGPCPASPCISTERSGYSSAGRHCAENTSLAHADVLRCGRLPIMAAAVQGGRRSNGAASAQAAAQLCSGEIPTPSLHPRETPSFSQSARLHGTDQGQEECSLSFRLIKLPHAGFPRLLGRWSIVPAIVVHKRVTLEPRDTRRQVTRVD